jgi:ribose 5-phosphate isomerase B
MIIGIASDHRGFKKKIKIIKFLKNKKYQIKDYGTDSLENVDYVDFAFKLGAGINNKEIDFGIALCSNGIGMSIACNKVKNIRCAKVNNEKEAKEAREDNNVNAIALSSQLYMFEIKDIISKALKTKFKSFERYNRRIEKLRKYEEK